MQTKSTSNITSTVEGFVTADNVCDALSIADINTAPPLSGRSAVIRGGRPKKSHHMANSTGTALNTQPRSVISAPARKPAWSAPAETTAVVGAAAARAVGAEAVASNGLTSQTPATAAVLSPSIGWSKQHRDAGSRRVEQILPHGAHGGTSERTLNQGAASPLASSTCETAPTRTHFDVAAALVMELSVGRARDQAREATLVERLVPCEGCGKDAKSTTAPKALATHSSSSVQECYRQREVPIGSGATSARARAGAEGGRRRGGRPAPGHANAERIASGHDALADAWAQVAALQAEVSMLREENEALREQNATVVELRDEISTLRSSLETLQGGDVM